MRTPHRTTCAATLACFISSIAAPALAQQQPDQGNQQQPAPPPPGYQQQQPPPGYQQPPPGYQQPPPGYQHPPPGYPQQPYPQQGYPQQYAPPYQPPPHQVSIVGYKSRPRMGLIIGGAVLTGVVWSITALAGAIASDVCDAGSSLGCASSLWPLYVPVIGPFIEMGYVNGSGSNSARALLFIDGLAQAGGLAMIIIGAAAKKRLPVYAGRVHVLPYATLGGAGLAALGRF